MSHQLWSSIIKRNISPNQIYLIDCYKNKIRPTLIINQDAELLICKSKGLIDEQNNVTPRGLEALEEFQTFLVKTKKKVTKEVLGENFMENITKYRELFPAERLPSKQYARQSVEELKDKFIWFFKTYPQFSWELVFDATDYYIYLKKVQPVPYQYMMTSSYFIKKSDGGNTRSALADTCQELLENPNI